MGRTEYSIDRLSVKLLDSCIHQAQGLGMWESLSRRKQGFWIPPMMRIKLSVQIQAEETNKQD